MNSAANIPLWIMNDPAFYDLTVRAIRNASRDGAAKTLQRLLSASGVSKTPDGDLLTLKALQSAINDVRPTIIYRRSAI